MGYGWGTFIGMIADKIPGRKESLRNKRQKLMREMDEILKNRFTPAARKRYDKLATKLFHVEQKLSNS